ncbi:formyl transferase [Algibacter marinivivus]|uniref:phosphoribosylglycinamide formyltransferase 1 n=1 Tax=Algibacter marinivivus TaxID=2100723 RepID=A0A2U2X3S2_9FLAO|nr:formyl transferase [Algibacter marinivivus]PWH82410.1 formyl transferase [Algibacter marinivivus]
MDKKIIMILEDHAYAKMVFNSLKKEFTISHVIIDNGQSYSKLIKKRIKKLGLFHVIGQLLFRIVLIPYINFSAKNRIKNILNKNNIEDVEINDERITRITSVNSKEGHDLLKELNPDIVVIVSHRIISKKTLDLTRAKFINIHAGITPLYRGLHGGYWSLINNDKTNCGVTVHLVDEGIDTGGILYQDTITDIITPKDNFISYTYLQLAKALPLLKKAIRDVQSNNIKIQKPKCKMGKDLYYQPTFWFYLYNRWIRNIK